MCIYSLDETHCSLNFLSPPESFGVHSLKEIIGMTTEILRSNTEYQNITFMCCSILGGNPVDTATIYCNPAKACYVTCRTTMYTDREASDENDTEHIYLKFAMDKKKQKQKFKI